MKQTPLKRTPMKRGPSPKQRKDRSEMAAIRPIIYERSGGMCEHCHEKPGADLHHKQRRSQGGTNTLENLVLLCSECHRWVHNNVAEAVKLGLLTRMGPING